MFPVDVCFLVIQRLQLQRFEIGMDVDKVTSSGLSHVAFLILFRPIDPISQNVQQWLLGARN